jgi:capsular polysaccharide biosynthesis protein
MSERPLDLKRSVQIARRRKVLIGLFAMAGLLAGGAYSMISPVQVTSTALVLLPQSAVNTAAAAAAGNNTSFTATQVVIAASNPVLADALPAVKPGLSINALRDDIQVSSPTSYIISISARSRSAIDSEAIANAVARSYISYVNSPGNPIGAVSAGMLQPAANATGRSQLPVTIALAVAGALGGALIGFIIAIAVTRKDRRLWERDEIANSIGVPVLASLPSSHPATAADWAELLEGYQPDAVHGWRLRQLLHLLRAADGNPGNGSGEGKYSLTVLTLSSDSGALAIGPQLAVFAAFQGIPTLLIIGPQQDVNLTAELRTACSVPPSPASKRPAHFHVAVAGQGDAAEQSDSVLTVVVAVVDSQHARLPEMMHTTATVLGVSAGAAASEQLARAAVSAAADGRDLVGILVADADPADRTTGRAPQLLPPLQPRLPARLRGMTTEISR